MQTKRDRVLIIALCSQAAISAAAGSSSLAQLAPVAIVAAVGLLSSMLSAATAVYVSVTREPYSSAERMSERDRYGA